jgi:hypothetical protein
MTYERTCKYGCNTQLGEFDTKENKFLETDGKTLHTRERCESLKQQKNGSKNGNNDLSLEVVLKKLASIGITIDLEKLRNL